MPQPLCHTTPDPRASTVLRRLLNTGQSEAILVAEFLADLSNSNEHDLDLLRTSAEELRDSAQAFLDATASDT